MLERVGTLWSDGNGGKSFSGVITLPRPLDAGLTCKALIVRSPSRGKKEKYELHLMLPLPPPPPEPPGPDDIIFKGEVMAQYFRPPRPPGKRYKIMLWGDSGSAKTKSALEFPHCAYVDNHGSAEPYETGYPQHLYSHPEGPDDAMAAVTSLLRDPGDRLTVVMDDATTYWDQVQIKWSDLFLKRLPRSKGHHAEFYTFQPSDWVHPKREMKALIQRLIALDLNVVIVARAKKEYAGSGDDFMKVIGEIFAGERNLVYEFDYIFRLSLEGDKRFATLNKQRVPAGGKPFPDRFEFTIDAQGRSTFFQVFQQYALPQHFTTPPHQVADPVKEAAPPETEHPPETVSPGTIKTAGAFDLNQVPQGISPAKLDELKQLKGYYKMSNEEWGKTLRKFYNVTTAKALTGEQADQFINYLKTQRVPF